MKILIIIPTYNENDNIEALIREINIVLSGVDFSIAVVDDNSSDGTRETIDKLLNEFDNLHLIKREKKLGLATAYIDGFKYGIANGFTHFIEMDADFSHNPKYLTKFADYFKNYDVVIGSRNIKNGDTPDWSIIRKIISKGGSIYSKLILNCPVNDLTGGFNGWSKEILQKINLDNIISKGYSFQIEMKYRAYLAKANIIEFPIIFLDRKKGNSKMSKKIFIEALINVIKLRFRCSK